MKKESQVNTMNGVLNMVLKLSTNRPLRFGI